MNSTLNNNIEVGLIINDWTSTKIHISLSYVSNEVISKICNELSLKYYQDERTKRKLYHHLCREIIILQNKRERIETIGARRNPLFTKLYYEGIKKQKEKA